MRKALKIAGLLLLVTALIGSWKVYETLWGTPASIHTFADRVMLRFAWEQPELLTFVGVLENTPLDFHSNRLSDPSPSGMEYLRRLGEVEYQVLQSYDTEDLDHQEGLTYAFMDWQLSSALALDEYPYNFDAMIYAGPYPANQISGAQSFPLTILNQAQQVEDANSARRFIQRVEAIGPYIDSLVVAVERRDQLQANPPKIIVEKTLQQIRSLTATAAEDWSLQATLQGHLAELDLHDDAEQELLSANLTALESVVIPAYQRLQTLMEDILLRAPDDVGVWVLPDGEAYYQDMLYRQASTRKSPDEIHQLGLELVARLGAEIDAGLLALGYTEGSRAERIEQMKAEPGARYPDSDAGREQIIADFTRIGKELEEGVRPAFNQFPDTAVEVVRVPEFQQDGEALARYMPPSLDGERPGRFMINLRAPAELEKHGMRTLSAHEAVPGHHFEIALAQGIEGIPMMRRNALLSSFSEGWALYVEQVVFELGLHDERSNIGRLQAQMFRAVRLVVDTGIHAKRWSRQRAIDYMLAETGMPEGEVVSEIDRYIAMPGQACSYMLGMQALLAAREQAQQRLGDAFSLPEFHSAVLANGPLPIDALSAELSRALQ